MTGEKLRWISCGLTGAAAVGAALVGAMQFAGLLSIVSLALAAIAFMCRPGLRGYAFTIWVFAFVATSLVYPRAFGAWLGVDLKILIVPLIQIITFGMGTTLCLADFTRVLRRPWPVLVGMLLQFSVMPLAGYFLAGAFGFEPEIAAGVVLIGSVPGGVASNVMAYIAGADVALSVTMTSCSTLLSPLMTPLLMKWLASQYVAIDVVGLVLDICNMILAPIVAGLIANRVLNSRAWWCNRAAPLTAAMLIGLAVAAHFAWTGVAAPASMEGGVVLGLVMIGVVAAVKWAIGVAMKNPVNWMDRALPVVSMAAICLIIAIITARSRADLLRVGPLLIAAAVAHNSIGYLLGYWGGRLVKLDERTCRTIAFEVGMQNGGMASGLAMNSLGSAKAALAPAIFGPWMNVSGSVLATWWHRKPALAADPGDATGSNAGDPVA